MKHKGLLFFCCILLVIGIGVAAFGAVLGGSFGGFYTSDNQVYYRSLTQKFHLGPAPRWMRGWNWNMGWRDGWEGGWHSSIGSDTDETDWNTPLSTPTPAGGPSQTVTANAADLQTLDIDIAAGYVKIVPGEKAELVVNGPLDYNSNFVNGKWNITCQVNAPLEQITSLNNRFYLNGEDVTTTFTLTVPKTFDTLRLSTKQGYVEMQGLSVEKLTLDMNIGAANLKDCSATDASFSNNIGNTNISGFSATSAKLKNDIGNITFSGEVTETLDMNCNLGRISASVPRPASYSMDATVDLGTLTVDGKPIRSVKNSGGSALPHFKLFCNLGTVNLAFT